MAKQILVTQDTHNNLLIVEHWLVGEGDQVTIDQPLVTIRDEGRFLIVRAPFDGFLFIKKLFNGDSFTKDVSLGELVTWEEAGNIKITDTLTRQERKIIENLHQRPANKNIRDKVHVKATPSARQEARKNNINIEDVQGTGPDGRIQLKDIKNYLKNMNDNKKIQQKETPQNVVYGLPPTPLARRLAQKYNLDLSKVPGPPGATRLRKKDVERFLRSPESAEAILLQEYFAPKEEQAPVEPKEEAPTAPPLLSKPQVTASLPEPEPLPTIKLPSEAGSHIPSDNVIELDQKIQVSVPALESPLSKLLLQEPPVNDGTVIRLTTDIPLSALSNGTIELEQVYQVDLLKLMGPDTYYALTEPGPEAPIRLPSEEISEIPSDSPILLEEGEEIKQLSAPTEENHDELLSEFLAGNELSEEELEILLSDSAISNMLKLSTGDSDKLKSLFSIGPERIVSFTAPAVIDLKALSQKLDLADSTLESAEVKLWILATVNKVVREELYENAKGSGSLLIQSLDNQIPVKIKGTTESYLEKELKLAKGLIDNITVDQNAVYLIDLLNYTLSEVSGVIDPSEHTALYLSRKDKERINISVQFSTLNLPEEKALELLESIKDELENGEVSNHE